MNINFNNLGFRPDPLDTRDIPLGAAVSDIVLPRKYSAIEGLNLKVEDQNGSSSCVGQTFSKYAEVLNWKETKTFQDLSAKWIYSRIALSGGGAYLRDACKVLTGEGVAPEHLDSSYPNTEADLTKKNVDPIVVNSALVYKAKAYVLVQNLLNDLKKAIYTGHGIGIGSNVSSEGWGYQQVKNNGGYVKMPKTGESISGHAYYLHSFDDDAGRFTGLNSWSEQWGIKGHFYFDYNDINWLFSGWTIVDAPNELVDNAKNMYNLIRNPFKPNEVYALSGKVVRHIANLQTLKLGDTEPDRFWKWESMEIPVATQADWNSYEEADEIHLDPKD